MLKNVGRFLSIGLTCFSPTSLIPSALTRYATVDERLEWRLLAPLELIDVRKRLLTGEELVKSWMRMTLTGKVREFVVGKPPAPCIYNFPFHRSKRTVLETRLGWDLVSH